MSYNEYEGKLMTIGERIREERNRLHITQKELGDMVAVSNKTISSYESDRTEPDYQTVQKLSKVFNVSCEYLLNGSNGSNTDASRRGIDLLLPVIGLIFVFIMASGGMHGLYINGGQKYFVYNQLLEYMVLPLIVFFSCNKISNQITTLKNNQIINKSVTMLFTILLFLSFYFIVLFSDNSISDKTSEAGLIYKVKYLIDYILTERSIIVILIYSLLGTVKGLFSSRK